MIFSILYFLFSFFNVALIAALNGEITKLALGGMKAVGSKVGVKLGPVSKVGVKLGPVDQ